MTPPATVRIWLITGEPGIGKTTCLSRAIDTIKSGSFTVGGVISREVKVRGERTAFEMIDLKTGESDVLASKSLDAGPKLGRYRVNLRYLAEGGVKALISSFETSDLTVIDEIGPMEMFSPEFRRAVVRVVDSGRPVVGVIHKRLKDPLLIKLRSAECVRLLEVTLENRDALPVQLANEVMELLRDDV